MDFLVTLARVVELERENPAAKIKTWDEGDGIMDMMLKPTLTTYESKDKDKDKKDSESEDED